MWFRTGGILLACAVILSGCAKVRPDPEVARANVQEERLNRSVHNFNLGVDRVVLRPTSNTYGEVVPRVVQSGVSNFANNLALPGDIVNNLLQFRIADASHNAGRFLVNSTIGLVGLVDVAGASGAPGAPTDFGETLFVWGLPEGAYMELPFAGPSTARHTVGRVVDVVFDPINVLRPDAQTVARAFSVGGLLGSRYQNSDLIDSVLYDSADSYSQSKLLYLQNRRFTLDQKTGVEADYLDPYEDDPYDSVE